MNKKDRESCINTIKSLRRLAMNIHGCIDVVDDQNCDKMIEILESEPRWIPCEERLPEKEGWYITTVESEKTGRRRIENDLFAVDIALAHGHTPNKFCKDGYRQRTVAWMPFPEPWKGKADEMC